VDAADRPEMRAARGLPIVFRRFRQQLRRGGWVERELALPGEGSIIETA
jgi:hypothetical protein